MTQGDSFEFSAKYLDLIMPYIKLVNATPTDTFYNL